MVLLLHSSSEWSLEDQARLNLLFHPRIDQQRPRKDTYESDRDVDGGFVGNKRGVHVLKVNFTNHVVVIQITQA